MDHTPDLSSEFSSEISTDVLDLMKRFENAWQDGKEPSIEDYLPADSVARRTVVLALIRIDLERRFQTGQAVRVEDYLRRFPVLRADPKAVVELIQAEYGRVPESSALIRRIPHSFEQAWKRLPRPDIMEYLSRAPDKDRRTLFHDLLSLELELRRRDGESPEPEHYFQRFPDYVDAVAAVFASSGTIDYPVNRGHPGHETRREEGQAQPLAARDPAKDDVPPRLGRYRITGKIGSGGFGVVYKGFDEDLQRDVAVKVPHRRHFARPENAELFLSEARILASLHHPHIVPIHDFGRTDDGLCYMVSTFVGGTDLCARLKKGPFAAGDAATLVACVAEALHHAHQRGLVHRDVKPANILLDADGQPVLVDFGVALTEEAFGRGANFVGTLYYMSPEQARGEGHRVDARSDIYSLGVVLFELLTGSHPLPVKDHKEWLDLINHCEPRPPRQLNRAVPKELDRICLKALALRAADRYSTAQDFADDLRQWLAAAQSDPLTKNAAISPAAVPVPSPGSERGPAHIVPKGLRSFDAEDADFFLELLPGPRDRDGLPEGVRFWKTRIEERDPDKTFSVGLLFGPSGCGKSSLVKAGLIPCLAPHVVVLYMEASPEKMGLRLLHGLRKLFPTLPSAGLPEALACLRRSGHLADDRKLVLILDQFEQWLHANSPTPGQELVQALRQCDGRKLQAVISVRDDFGMAAARLMHELEISIVEGRNFATVDLFDPKHARKVALGFGRAFGALPDNPADLTAEQNRFLDDVVAGLSTDGRVISIRLALFCEMIKTKPWIPATLAAVGGTQGIGVAFLEETLGSRSSNPAHRFHQAAARSVLLALLPPGTPIKGHHQSHAQLLQASGYQDDPRRFAELLHILENELRLITPTEPEATAEGKGAASGSSAESLYQLTHDYLVHSLREWLTRKKRETRRGRAELLLDERAADWNRTREKRHLPTGLEFFYLLLLTRWAAWSGPQKRMMRRALFQFGRGFALVAGLLFLAVLILPLVLPQPTSPFDVFLHSGEGTAARLKAFEYVVISKETFPHISQVIENNSDNPELVCPILAKLADGAMKGDDDFLNLILKLIGNDGRAEVQVQAFKCLAAVAAPILVLDTVKKRYREKLTKALGNSMLEYIEKLTVEEVPEEIPQKLLEIIRQGPAERERLIDACVDRLDQIPPERLCALFIRAFRTAGDDSIETADLSIVPYAQNNRNKKGLEKIASYVEERLRRTMPAGSAATIPCPFELGFYIRAMGALRKETNGFYPEAIERMSSLVENRNRLENRSLLPAIIESLGQLSDEGATISKLRDILTQDRDRLARSEAARVLAKWQDPGSVSALVRIAHDGKTPISLRKVALSSAAAIAKRHEHLLKVVLPALEEIIGWKRDGQDDLLREAMEAFGELARPDHAKCLLPRLFQPDLDTTAVVAFTQIILRYPEVCQPLVKDYLQWRRLNTPADKSGLKVFAEDDPIFGFALSYISDRLSESMGRQRVTRSQILAARAIPRILFHEGLQRNNQELVCNLLRDYVPKAPSLHSLDVPVTVASTIGLLSISNETAAVQAWLNVGLEHSAGLAGADGWNLWWNENSKKLIVNSERVRVSSD